MRIDWWTLALQTVNVLVLVWLLARFLFRPVMDIIDRRRAAAEQLLADASAVQARAQSAEAEVLARQQRLAADADRVLAEAHAKAAAEGSALLERAAEERAKRQAQADAAIAHEREAMWHGVLDDAAKLAVAIACKLLARLRPEVATMALLEALAAELAKLPAATRDDIGKSGEPIEVVTAAPLGEREQAHCRDLLAGALHAQPAVTFRADPDLIAGAELRAAHMLFRNSWQADLDRISRELRQEDEHAAAVG